MSLADLLTQTTPGPWERGDIWMLAGVKAEMFGEGRCAGCRNHGEPVWVGRTDINGTVMVAHRHRVADPYDPDHVISGANGETVCGMFDYEQGGVTRGDDARLIALAPDLAKLAIDMAAELRRHSSEEGHDYINHAKADALLARFAALDQRATT